MKTKQPFWINLIILLLLIFNVAYAQDEKPPVPKIWGKFQACGLSFYAPSNLKEERVQGIDSCVKEYRSKSILFSLDVVSFGGKESNSRRNEYSDKKDFQIEKVEIDGRKAEVITHYETEKSEQWNGLFYGAILYVPVINKDGSSLTIWTHNRSQKDREIAKKIFETVQFGK